jgi:hypothetical protein
MTLYLCELSQELNVAEMCSKDGIHEDVRSGTAYFVRLVEDFFIVLTKIIQYKRFKFF